MYELIKSKIFPSKTTLGKKSACFYGLAHLWLVLAFSFSDAIHASFISTH